MSQRSRFDEPGAWLHVMNRGVARRTVFETRSDMRYFLACTAKAVRTGWFEIHAFSLLATHFHLLIRSSGGESWRGMRRAQNAYSRRFNIQRRRDGPLFRGRFRSKRVRSDRYWTTVVRYIDQNPVAARLVECPEAWPHGSAAAYMRRTRGPLWLARTRIEEAAARASGGSFDATAYRAAFGSPLGAFQRAMVERRLDTSADVDDPFDDIVGVAPSRVAAWMRRKAALADGTQPGVPVVDAATLEAALAARRPDLPSDDDAPGAPGAREWLAVRAGLLRMCAGATYREIGLRLDRSEAGAHGLVRAFKQLVAGAAPSANAGLEALVSAIEADWPAVQAAD